MASPRRSSATADLSRLHAGALRIVISHELGTFYTFGQQAIPDGCRRPGEHDPRDAKWAANPLAQFLNLCCASVCDRPESFKPRPQMLQFATFAKTANEGLPVDGSDGFQHPCGHVGQLAKRLLGRREETLEFGDGGRPLLAFDADRLIAAHGVSSNPAGFLLDCRRERASGERLVFRLGLDEGRSLDVERFPSDVDGLLEPSVRLRRFLKAPP